MKKKEYISLKGDVVEFQIQQQPERRQEIIAQMAEAPFFVPYTLLPEEDKKAI
jgi:hypothetical protein